MIKGEKAKGTKFETSDMGRFRIDSSKIIEFEHELYSQINARLLKQALTFELIKIQGSFWDPICPKTGGPISLSGIRNKS